MNAAIFISHSSYGTPTVTVVNNRNGQLIEGSNARTLSEARKDAIAYKNNLLSSGRASEVVIVDELKGEELGTWRRIGGKVVKVRDNPPRRSGRTVSLDKVIADMRSQGKDAASRLPKRLKGWVALLDGGKVIGFVGPAAAHVIESFRDEYEIADIVK